MLSRSSCHIVPALLATLLYAGSPAEAQESPRCSLSTTELDFGRALVGTEIYRNVELKNDSGVILQFPRPGLPMQYFNLIGHGGPISIFPYSSYTLTVRYHPYEAGLVSATMDLGPCGTVALRAEAIAAAPCAFSTTTIDFHIVEIGTVQERSFSLMNVGTSLLAGQLELGCADDFSIADDRSYSLEPGESKTFTVRFAPTSRDFRECTIDPGNGCSYVNLMGAGDDPPLCWVELTRLPFGDSVAVGASYRQSFSIRNSGGLTVTGNIVEDGPDFEIVGDTHFDLTRNRDMLVHVRFAPTRPGPQSCTIELGDMCVPVTCHGYGFVEEDNSVSPLELNFGRIHVGESDTRLLTIRNVTEAGITASATSSCEVFALGNETSFQLEPGEAVDVPVTFRPAAAGEFECSISTGVGHTVLARGIAENLVPTKTVTWGTIKARFR